MFSFPPNLKPCLGAARRGDDVETFPHLPAPFPFILSLPRWEPNQTGREGGNGRGVSLKADQKTVLIKALMATPCCPVNKTRPLPHAKVPLNKRLLLPRAFYPPCTSPWKSVAGGGGERVVRCGCSLLLFWLSEKYAVCNKPPRSHLHHDFRSRIQKLFGSGGRFIGA